MVHLGDSSNRIWHSVFDGSNWSPNVEISGQSSKAPPALAAFNGRLHMVHLGDSSNRIWHSVFDGSNWSPNVEVPSQSSKASPALAVFNGRLHMVHLGDTSNNLWYSQFNGDKWTVNVRIPNQSSQASVAVGSFGRRVHLVHIGDSSHNLWHSVSDGRLSIVRIGAKILLNQNGQGVISDATFSQWLTSMRTVYASMGISVDLMDTERLNLPDLLIVDAGRCVSNEVTQEQRTLFENRNNLGGNDIAVYFVQATVPAYNGCAAHPDNVPACVVVSSATQWTMAHECGHVLGLSHVDDNTRLMTGNGTSNIIDPPPDLTYEEAETMGNSQYSQE
jgi:hypothetical protein